LIQGAAVGLDTELVKYVRDNTEVFQLMYTALTGEVKTLKTLSDNPQAQEQHPKTP